MLKIIGWLLLAVLVLSVISVAMEGSDEAAAPEATPAPAPAVPRYSVQLVATECTDNYGRNKAHITIRNTGQAIPYAKGFVEFVDASGKVLSAQDSYFRPTTIPAGATASMTAYSSGGGANRCGLSTIQDRDGNPVAISAD